MPQSLVIEIYSRHKKDLTKVSPIELHGCIFNLLHKANLTLAQEIHQQDQKPFVLSPIYTKDDLQTYCFRLSSYQDSIPTSIQQYILANFKDLSLELGKISVSISRILSHSGGQEIWARQQGWDDMWGQASESERFFNLQFYSPTAFKSGELIIPLPSPEKIFNSYLRSWNKFAPHSFDAESLQTVFKNQLAITAYDIRTAKIQHFRGFIGSVTLECVGAIDSLILKQLNTLANFSFYCGTGYKTTMGCGWTQRI